MAKTTNNRKTSVKVARTRNALKDDSFTYGFSSSLKTDAIVEKMTRDLIAYSRATPAPKNIINFFLDRGMSPQTYYDLLDRYPKLRQAHENALLIIGDRLWEGAVDRRSDWAPVKWRLHRYNKEFKEIDEYHVGLAAKSKGTDSGTDSKNIYVIDSIKKMEE